MQVMAAPAYIAEHGMPATLEALSNHVIIQLADEPAAWPLLDQRQLPVTATHRINDLYTLGCLVGAGIGIALMLVNSLGVPPTMQGLKPVLPELLGTRKTALLRAGAHLPRRPDRRHRREPQAALCHAPGDGPRVGASAQEHALRRAD